MPAPFLTAVSRPLTCAGVDFFLSEDLHDQVHFAHVLLIGVRLEVRRDPHFETFRLQPRHDDVAETLRRVAVPTAVDEQRFAGLVGGEAGG